MLFPASHDQYWIGILTLPPDRNPFTAIIADIIGHCQCRTSKDNGTLWDRRDLKASHVSKAAAISRPEAKRSLGFLAIALITTCSTA